MGSADKRNPHSAVFGAASALAAAAFAATLVLPIPALDLGDAMSTALLAGQLATLVSVVHHVRRISDQSCTEARALGFASHAVSICSFLYIAAEASKEVIDSTVFSFGSWTVTAATLLTAACAAHAAGATAHVMVPPRRSAPSCCSSGSVCAAPRQPLYYAPPAAPVYARPAVEARAEEYQPEYGYKSAESDVEKYDMEEDEVVDVSPLRTHVFENGDRYGGEWKDGLMHGCGTYTWADGHVYVGEFVTNLKHGQGVEFAPNGEMLRAGTFCNDEFIGEPPADAPLVAEMSDEEIREELRIRKERRAQKERLATMSSDDILRELERRAGERMSSVKVEEEENNSDLVQSVPKFFGSKAPITVTVTGGAGQIAYSLIPHLLNGYVFGPNQRVVLKLLDIPPAMTALEGVKMEVEDLSYPLLDEIVACTDPAVAFNGADYCVFLGAFPRKKGMERKDLMEKNVGIFKAQGEALARYGKKTCKSVVVGNPANTNALTLMRYAPDIPKENFSALTRLDANRLRSQVAIKLGTKLKSVSNTFIWGNHSSTQYPDIHNATANGKAVLEQVDEKWYKETLIPVVQKRGAAIINARGLSSAASAAKGAADHLKDWIQGTKEGAVSMAVISDGNKYGIPDGLMYSFPVVCSGGKWKIVNGLKVSAFSREMMDKTAAELQEEKAIATEILESL